MPRSAEGYEGVVELKMADGWVGGFLQTHKVKPGWHGFQYEHVCVHVNPTELVQQDQPQRISDVLGAQTVYTNAGLNGVS